MQGGIMGRRVLTLPVPLCWLACVTLRDFAVVCVSVK